MPAASATKNPEVITPIIIDGTTPSAQGMPAPEMPSADQNPVIITTSTPAAGSEAQPVPLSPPPTITATPSASAAPAAAPAPDTVQGFANQVPLTVALRELLPPGYGFSIDQDVDMGVLVSFQGGKPWRGTLAAALEPVGLVMREQAQMISIGRIPPQVPVTQNSPAPAAPVASAAPAMPTAAPAPVPAPAPLPLVAAAPTSVALAPAPSPAMPAPAMVSAPAPAPAPTAIALDYGAGSAAAVPVTSIQVWTADRGDSLRKVLQDWSHRVHAEVEWLAEYDYPLQASINYSGTYEEAVRNLLIGFEGAHPEPVAQLHINSELGQTVLVVRTRGNSSKD
jgi:hypothetical protein